ncbi:MAG: hypothetical protein PWP38_1153, partial [Clostridiales bacterium]|nr:hypothetical protein [Clostridiales bacterium]
MQMALIESKLNRPKTLATHINRPHLTARLIEANVPMVLVSSVAGSGKSSLISSWLKESHIKRYVWYSLDEWDSDFILFFNYLAEGIRRIEPSIGDTLTSLLLNASSFDHAGLVRAAVGVLQTLEQPIYLVLDDYHLVENADIDNAIRAFVTYLNSQLVVVLISREDPMIDLSTLRMRQKLLEIRQADLSLNEMETAAYLRTFLGASYALSKQHVMMLYQRTEGWLAGLQLAGISLQSQRDTSAFIESFSGNHRYIMDYLIQEVAAKLTADETIFLMTSTILEKFCAPLLDSLIKGLPNETVNHTNAQQLIRQLMKKNLFVIELDAVQYWYRYHHLFRDSLIRYFLEKEPAVYRQYAAAVNCLAGDWYAVQNQGLEASRYYLKGNCDQKAAMELERLWAPMDMMLQTASWLTLANQLPESVIAERPLFSLAYGWALIDNGRLGDSKQWLDNASALVEALPAPLLKEKQLVSDWETYVHFHALLASARGFIAGAAGDFDSLMQYGEQALATGSAKKSGVTHMMMAFANWGQGNHVGAEQQLKNAVSAEGIHGEWLNVQNFKMVLMEHYIQTGRLAKADTLIQQLLNEGENDSVLYPTLYLGMARIAYSRGETRLCGEWLERAAKAGNVCALMDFQYKYAFFTAIFHADQGAFEEAFKQLEIGKKHFFPNPIPDMYTASAVEAWLTAMKHQRAAEIVETVDTDL